MDESLQNLENELKRLRPSVPSAQLLARLDAEFAAPEIARDRSRANGAEGQLIMGPWLNWRMAAAAAAVVAFSTVVITSRQSLRHDPVAPTTELPVAVAVALPVKPAEVPVARAANLASTNDRYHPVGATSVLYDFKEDSPVARTTSTPTRRVRYRYVDTYTWKNPATNASLKWSLPRDEVRVIPASLH